MKTARAPSMIWRRLSLSIAMAAVETALLIVTRFPRNP
jgi:hypothetical protein